MKKLVSAVLALLVTVSTVWGMSGVAFAADSLSIKEQVMAALRENVSEDSLLDEEMLLLIEDVMDLVMKNDPVIDEKEYAALYNKVKYVDLDVNSSTKYVSIGGSYVDAASLDEDMDEYPFGQLLADHYSIASKQYTSIGKQGYRAEELLYILDSSFNGDEYTRTLIKTEANREKYRTTYTAKIAAADLITVAVGSDSFTSYLSKQMTGLLFNQGVCAMDWSLYLDENGVAQINRLVAEMEAYLTENGAADFAPMVSSVVECFAYAYIGFSYSHAALVDKIHEINPNAQVVILGMYNIFDGLVYATEEEEMYVGEYADYFIALTNSIFASYAANTENTSFIEIPDVTTEFDGKQVISMDPNDTAGMITAIGNIFISLGNTKILPNAEGHEYIKDQLVKAIEEEPPTVVKGDLNDDGVINGKDIVLIRRYDAGLEIDYINLEAADINGDGVVNGRDVIKLRQYDAGIIDSIMN